jgi:hypothetical protein
MIRWTCPNGLHPGALGPQRPRKDSIVRFCWPCSIKAGHLVQRIAPSIESKKRRKAETKARKQERKLAAVADKAAKATAAACAIKAAETSDLVGLDWVGREYARLQALPFATSNLGSSTRPKKRARDNALGRRLYGPTQPWNHAQVTGRQYPHENRITVTVGPKATRARVSELLMHELCHAACPTERGAPGKNGKRQRIYHGRTFREWLVRAAKEAYGLEISPTAAGRSAYKLDKIITTALEAKGGEWSRLLETP